MIYSKNLATTATYMKCLPPMLHFMAYFMPEWYTLHRNKQKLHCLLEPSIKKFLDDRKSGSDPSLKSKAGTMLDCYTETLPESEMTLDKLAHRLVGCTFGAFQGTSSLAMNSVLDLATHFETYAPGLRQEIDEVLGDEEIITNTHLAKMWKLDSFVKEALRFHPLTTRMSH
jgi:cytochrome P450